MSSSQADGRVARIVRSTIAYAAGVSESSVADCTGIPELGIDSVAMLAAGAVLQAELELAIAEHDVLRIFMADTVADAIVITSELYAAAEG